MVNRRALDLSVRAPRLATEVITIEQIEVGDLRTSKPFTILSNEMLSPSPRDVLSQTYVHPSLLNLLKATIFKAPYL